MESVIYRLERQLPDFAFVGLQGVACFETDDGFDNLSASLSEPQGSRYQPTEGSPLPSFEIDDPGEEFDDASSSLSEIDDGLDRNAPDWAVPLQ